jgi:hypothetical protein
MRSHHTFGVNDLDPIAECLDLDVFMLGLLKGFQMVSTTLAPSAARRLAIAAPMPREPPVTSATLPASGASSLAWSDMIGPPRLSFVYRTVQ